jgi:hypothetical protein
MVEPNDTRAEREATLRGRTTAVEALRGVERPFARISWGAIFALATQLVLTLIGTAVGLATLNPATGENPSGTTLGIGAGVWLVISSLVSLFLGGYVAGRLGGTFNGWLHGLATWATVTMLTILLLTTAAGGGRWQRLSGARLASDIPFAKCMWTSVALQADRSRLRCHTRACGADVENQSYASLGSADI